MSATDYLRLNEHKIFKELKESLPKCIGKTMKLVAVHDSVFFTWDFENNCVLCLNIKAARSRDGDNVIHQKLLPLHPPLFSPESIIVNGVGTLLASSGPNGVLILQLPHRCPPYGAFANHNKEVVYCRSFSLDERMLCYSDTLEVRQVKFHPGSVDHNHILVLTSDNTLRLYKIEEDEAINVSTYSVGEKPSMMFPGSNTPFLDIYGEIAVDFDFGHPEISRSPLVTDNRNVLKQIQINVEEKYMINAQTQTVERIKAKNGAENGQKNKEVDNLVWPVYILRGDLTVFSINIDLHKRFKSALTGPLPLHSFDNNQTEACSLICLDTVPQIMCLALSNGTICHSILLDIDEDTLTEMKESAKSTSSLPSKEITAFEIVELEMGLKTLEEEYETKYKCPIFLHKDESKPGRYYATHSAGVHSVTVTCVDDLMEFVNAPEDAEATSDIFLQPSKAEYLVCTKTASSDQINPIIGFSLYYEPASVITLMSDGSLVTLGVLYVANLPKMEDIDENKNSPLKKMLKEPFPQFIHKILKKASTQPVLRLASTEEQTQEQCYEVLQRAAQIFRDEYFKCHMKAREELDKRIQTLCIMKKNQKKEIERMNGERDALQEQASNLAEKYEDIKDKQDELLKKCENLLMLVSRKKCQPSDAEKAFMEELQKCNEKTMKYMQAIEKIKNKTKYQQIQMENWKAQEVKKASVINETHTTTIKNNLVETTKKITEMIKGINDYKKLLNLN